MTTSFRADVPVAAADELDVAEEAARVTPLPARRPEVNDWRALPLDARSGSEVNASVLSRLFRRSVRTTAPLILGDIIALALAGLIAHVTVGLFHPAAAEPLHWLAPLAVLLLLLAGYWLAGLYSEIWIHPVIELRQLTHVSTVALFSAAVGGLFAPPMAMWCGFAWLAAVVLVPLLRTVVRWCCRDRSWWGYPTLIIGCGGGVEEMARLLLDCPRSGLRPVLLTDPEDRCRSAILPVVNDPITLESLLRTQGVRHAVVSLPSYSNARLAAMLDRYSDVVPHLLVLSDTSTLPTLWGASRSGGRLSGIEVRNGLLMATLQIGKRLADLTVALLALIIALPILLGVIVLMKLGGGGAVFFGHTRIGRHGRLFKAWKFRTMHPHSDKILREYLERVAGARAEWDRDQKLRDDPRVTRIGRLLRQTSLDELPQIWNVLRGDMSIVGPRPIVSAEIPRYGDAFRLYATVKPGITGLWQVSGRNDVSYDDRIRLDQFYVRHWSPWLDAYILAKTVVALLKRDGAY